NANKSNEKNNIQVAVRCRPIPLPDRGSNLNVEIINDRQELRLHLNDKSTKIYTFDRIFTPETNQLNIYKSMVIPMIEEVLEGYNCTLFAYGQTGTGKTHTMIGQRDDQAFLSWEDDPKAGIIPRALGQLFDRLEAMDGDYTMRISYLELYNEDIYDLLCLGNIESQKKLRIFEDSSKKGKVVVHGAEEVLIRCKNEAFDVLNRGAARRQIAETELNASSSRSHTLLTISMEMKDKGFSTAEFAKEETMKIGKLNLIDLAGSENISRSGASERRAREAGNINQSLLTLGRVINALVDGKSHIPYRESKLTRLLQDSLGGQTKTSIIATISLQSRDLEETVSTLEYARRAKKITNKPEVNQR
ncbi:uncharacterized protein TRIADDRAFT_3491, partial [Trichoplax adhaerens]